MTIESGLASCRSLRPRGGGCGVSKTPLSADETTLTADETALIADEVAHAKERYEGVSMLRALLTHDEARGGTAARVPPIGRQGGRTCSRRLALLGVVRRARPVAIDRRNAFLAVLCGRGSARGRILYPGSVAGAPRVQAT